MKVWQHFRTITAHKILVLKGCFRVGLYRQGLLHDMSKYGPTEFLAGCKYYRGYMSPNNAERFEKGYSSAWLHHKGRNRHHLEYWTDYGKVGDGIGIVSVEMPVQYVAEMFCDRLAASRVYRGEDFRQEDPWLFFQRTKKNAVLHEKTQALLEDMLLKLRDEGEEAAFAYIRREILAKEGK